MDLYYRSCGEFSCSDGLLGFLKLTILGLVLLLTCAASGKLLTKMGDLHNKT